MTLRATTFVLLIFWSELAMTQNAGDYESKQECRQAWVQLTQCYKKIMKDPAQLKYRKWGTPIAICIEGEYMNAPGVIFPTDDTPRPCDQE